MANVSWLMVDIYVDSCNTRHKQNMKATLAHFANGEPLGQKGCHQRGLFRQFFVVTQSSPLTHTLLAKYHAVLITLSFFFYQNSTTISLKTAVFQMHV